MRGFKFISIILTFATLLVLSSCNHRKNIYRSNNATNTQTEIELDHNQCVSTGFTPGSFEYRECRDKLLKQRGGRPARRWN